MKRNIFAFFTLAVLSVQLAFGQAAAPAIKISKDERRAAEGVTARQMSDYLHFIASDAMQGRNTPSQGLDVTAEFIKMNLSKWGFKPAGDNGSYFQRIALKREIVDPAATAVSFGGQKYAYGQDIFRIPGTGASPVNAPIVFVGNGWMIKSKNLNPYAGIDVRGKVIAVYSEGPASSRNMVPLPAGITQADLTGTRGTDWADAATYARANGAAGVIILPSKFFIERWDQVIGTFGPGRFTPEKLQRSASGAGQANTMPIFVVSPKFANAIFAGEAGDPLNGAVNTFAVTPSKSFDVTLATKAETLWTQNVVAIWEGGDPTLKNEMVAIGAHYDHVGNAPDQGCRPVNGDTICNGADDDGSGTVGVLAIAEALSHSAKRPKRSVLFVWHCGEEKGLWGSEYFNKFPTVDIKQVIAQLNIDMIGRSRKDGDVDPKDKDLSGENAIYVIGKDMMSSTLGNIVSGVNAGYLNLGYDTRYDDPKDTNRFFFRSDHFNYAVNGIPITFWFDGVHVDYHQPGDEPDKIDYQKMEKVARTIMITLLKVADLKDRPKIDKTLPPELQAR